MRSFHIRILSSTLWRDEIRLYLDPCVCPVFWNDDKHSDFRLPMTRPNRVPSVITDQKQQMDDLEELHIKAGRVQWMEFELEKGDTLAFRVHCDSNFGFAVVSCETVEEHDVMAMRQLYPALAWLPGLRVPIEDSVVAPAAGLYKVWMSNARSWWSTITIQSRFEVLRKKSD